MDLLVCCKIVPDLDRLSDSDWVVQDHGRIDTGFVRTLVNPYDESALELALRLADAGAGSGASVRLTALTLGGRQADPALKTLLALRFHQAVRIETHGDWRFCPEGVAAAIGAYMEDGHPQDGLIMGRQSGDGDNGKTPLLAAERLGCPCITEVVRIEAAGPGRLRVTSRVDGGFQVQVARTPLVLAVGNAAGSALRVPTLKDRMQFGRRPVQVLDQEAFALGPALEAFRRDYALQGLALVSHRRAGLILAGDGVRSSARVLYEDCLKQRLEIR